MRLEVSGRAKASLWLAIAAVFLPPLVLLSWWAECSPANFLEADEPLLTGARWIRWTVLAGWAAAVAFALW